MSRRGRRRDRSAARGRARRTCEPGLSKVRYRDHAQATEALTLIRRNAEPGTKIPVRVYQCDWCDGYHLTSQKNSEES